MILRELRNDSSWRYLPVGFLDDDPIKSNKLIHGRRVYDTNGSLSEILGSANIEEILICVRNLPPEKLERLRTICRNHNVGLKRAQIKIESVDFE